MEDRTDVQLENVVIEDLLSDQTQGDGERKEEQGESHDSHRPAEE